MSLRLRRNLIFIVTWIKLVNLILKTQFIFLPFIGYQIKYLLSKLTRRIFLFSPTSQHQTKYKKFPTWLKFIKVESMFCKIILFLSQHGTSQELDSYIFGFIYFIYLNIVAVALSFIKLMLGLVYLYIYLQCICQQIKKNKSTFIKFRRKLNSQLNWR